MVKFIFRRILRGLVALFLFQSLLFVLISSVPYDFSVTQVGGGRAWQRFIQQLHGLNLPTWKQYLNWTVSFFTLDMGESFIYWPTSVFQVILDRSSRTLLLFLTATVLAYFLGMWLGKVIAWRRGGLLEIGATIGGVAAFTSFAPFLGFLVANVFGFYLHWLPYRQLVDPNIWFSSPVRIDTVMGWMLLTTALFFLVLVLVYQRTRRMRPPYLRTRWRGGTFIVLCLFTWAFWRPSGISIYAIDILEHLILPLIAVILLSFGDTMMLMRMAMLDTLQDDFVVMARAKGLPENAIRDRHVARNAMFPVLTRLLLNLPFVLVGSLIIEVIFTWRGMGVALFNAIDFVDLPLMMGLLSFVGILVLLIHIFLDILYVYLDPRLRYAS